MTFNDRFPSKLEFEVDHHKLVKLNRIVAQFGCYGACLLIASVLSLGIAKNTIVFYANSSFMTICGIVSLNVSLGLVAGMLLGSLFYFGYFRAAAKRRAENQKVLVEGPFLRVISGGYFVTDNRYHFREIHRYQISQGPLLRKLGLKTLSLYCSSGRSNQSSCLINIDGLANVDEVRDILCEIDAAREQVN